MLRYVRRFLFLMAFHLYAKKKMHREDRISLFGFDLIIPPTVFHPRLYFTSRVLSEFITALTLESKTFLDVGCGSGIISLVAAQKGARITSIDINPAAVEATKKNARLNLANNILDIFQSNLFENVSPESRFDYIVWNPPFFPYESMDQQSDAFNAGKNYSVIKQFSESAKNYLAKSGSIFIILTTDMDIKTVLSFFKEDYSIEMRESRRLVFETLFIYEIQRKVE